MVIILIIDFAKKIHNFIYLFFNVILKCCVIYYLNFDINR